MTPEEVIRLAREADLATEDEVLLNLEWTGTQEDLERFADLVAAAEREKTLEGISHIVDAAVKQEREECARFCEAYVVEGLGREMAEAIRARQ